MCFDDLQLLYIQNFTLTYKTPTSKNFCALKSFRYVAGSVCLVYDRKGKKKIRNYFFVYLMIFFINCLIIFSVYLIYLVACDR